MAEELNELSEEAEINISNDKIQNIFSPQIQIFEPFGAHVDPSRTNMSSKQILQIIPSRTNDTPFILNKAYTDFTEVKSNFTLRAKKDGILVNSDFNIMFIYYKEIEDGKTVTKIAIEYIPPVKKLLSHGLPLRYKRKPGIFKKGDLLFDYTGQTEEGLPKIGYRANVMYASFWGYTAEDAFVCSESFSRKAQVDYMEKIYIPITKKHKYIKNKNGKYFHNVGEFQGKSFLKYLKIDGDLNLDSSILNVSEDDYGYYTNDIAGLEDAEVMELKVHKLNPKPFTEVAKEYIYSPDLIQEVAKLYLGVYDEFVTVKKTYSVLKDSIPDIDRYIHNIYDAYKSSARLPSKLLNEIAESYRLIDKDIDYVLEIDILQTVPTTLGDKFANCFAGKGVVSMIIPDKYMPKDPVGNPVDIIFNPLGIYGRNNWGMIFETALASIIQNVELTIEDKDLTKEKIQYLNERFIVKFDKDYYDKVNYLIDNFDSNYENFKSNVYKNGFYLCVDNFPGIPYKEFYDDIIAPYAEKYNIITEISDYVFTKDLWDYIKRERNFKTVVTDETYDIPTQAYFGPLYYLKLQHTAYSKYNSVAQARSYNRANGQPAKGRKMEGGVHCGWQTINADQGHSDDSMVTKELLTFKADCTEEKSNFINSYVFSGEYNMKSEEIKSPTVTNISHVMALFGLRLTNDSSTIEASRETEKVRTQRDVERNAKFNKSNDQEMNLFDYDIDKMGEEDLQRLIDKEEEETYINNIVGNR